MLDALINLDTFLEFSSSLYIVVSDIYVSKMVLKSDLTLESKPCDREFPVQSGNEYSGIKNYGEVQRDPISPVLARSVSSFLDVDYRKFHFLPLTTLDGDFRAWPMFTV